MKAKAIVCFTGAALILLALFAMAAQVHGQEFPTMYKATKLSPYAAVMTCRTGVQPVVDVQKGFVVVSCPTAAH